MSKKKAAARALQATTVPRRSARSERNRQKLLDAAISILLGDGMAKFTSTHIAAAAGLHKPAFYTHFKNVEECLQAVALHVAQANVLDALAFRSKLDKAPEAIELGHHVIEPLLRSASQHEPLYRLLRRYQADDSPLGEAVRGINAFALERWTEHFWRVAVHYGVDPKHFREIARMAEYIVALSYIAIGRVLDKRVTDLSAEAARVARYGHAIMEAEFRRMCAESR